MAPQPSPLEGHRDVMAMVPAGSNPGPGSISLALLIDFIIQRTYHELTVLAELLHRKTDMERKIAIYQFATNTRQLFVRLLALVKWDASVSKVVDGEAIKIADQPWNPLGDGSRASWASVDEVVTWFKENF